MTVFIHEWQLNDKIFAQSFEMLVYWLAKESQLLIPSRFAFTTAISRIELGEKTNPYSYPVI